jgi:hypothetical protein
MDKDNISEAAMNPESISKYMVRAFGNYIKPYTLDPPNAVVLKQKAKALEDSYFKNKKIDKKILEDLAQMAFLIMSTGDKSTKKATKKSTKKSTASINATNVPTVSYNQVEKAMSGLSEQDKRRLLLVLQQQLATPPTTTP